MIVCHWPSRLIVFRPSVFATRPVCCARAHGRTARRMIRKISAFILRLGQQTDKTRPRLICQSDILGKHLPAFHYSDSHSSATRVQSSRRERVGENSLKAELSTGRTHLPTAIGHHVSKRTSLH